MGSYTLSTVKSTVLAAKKVILLVVDFTSSPGSIRSAYLRSGSLSTPDLDAGISWYMSKVTCDGTDIFGL